MRGRAATVRRNRARRRPACVPLREWAEHPALVDGTYSYRVTQVDQFGGVLTPPDFVSNLVDELSWTIKTGSLPATRHHEQSMVIEVDGELRPYAYAVEPEDVEPVVVDMSVGRSIRAAPLQRLWLLERGNVDYHATRRERLRPGTNVVCRYDDGNTIALVAG